MENEELFNFKKDYIILDKKILPYIKVMKSMYLLIPDKHTELISIVKYFISKKAHKWYIGSYFDLIKYFTLSVRAGSASLGENYDNLFELTGYKNCAVFGLTIFHNNKKEKIEMMKKDISSVIELVETYFEEKNQ